MLILVYWFSIANILIFFETAYLLQKCESFVVFLAHKIGY